jgi:hypothetical protein
MPAQSIQRRDHLQDVLVPEVEAYLKGRFATVYADNRGSYNRQLRQEVQKLFQEKGQLYLHAGLLVLNPWLADFAKAFKSWGGFWLQWLYQIFAGAVNFERARYLARHEFSRFLDRTAMSVSKSRALLKKWAHKYFVPCLNMLFKVNLENIIKTLEKAVSYFYADGHFDPYYGQTGMLPGWCCLLNRTMKGSNHYMIHNELGDPL